MQMRWGYAQLICFGVFDENEARVGCYYLLGNRWWGGFGGLWFSRITSILGHLKRYFRLAGAG